MSGQGQVKGQNRHFSRYLSATKTGLITAANPNSAKRLPKGMKKIAYRYGHYTKEKSRSGQIRSPNKNVVEVSCDTCFMGYLGRRIRWRHSFLNLARWKVNFKWKLGPIRSYFKIHFFYKARLSCPVSSQNSKNVIYFLCTTIRSAKKCVSEMWRHHLYLVFWPFHRQKSRYHLEVLYACCLYVSR